MTATEYQAQTIDPRVCDYLARKPLSDGWGLRSVVLALGFGDGEYRAAIQRLIRNGAVVAHPPGEYRLATHEELAQAQLTQETQL